MISLLNIQISKVFILIWITFLEGKVVIDFETLLLQQNDLIT